MGLFPEDGAKKAGYSSDGRAPASVAHGEVWALGKAQKGKKEAEQSMAAESTKTFQDQRNSRDTESIVAGPMPFDASRTNPSKNLAKPHCFLQHRFQ